MANTAPKTAKWNEAEVASLKGSYDPSNSEASVKAIAAAMGRTHRSVIGKLVSEGLYVKPDAKPAAKRDEGPTKQEIINDINALGIFDTEGFEQATKPALTRLLNFVAEVKAERDDENEADPEDDPQAEYQD